MKKEMETVYKNKDNVVYTISNDLNSCYDIDVPDDVETVMLGIREDETIRTGALILAFNLVKSEKSFPNVKKLIIGSHIFHISIPNALFPNVREVISYSKHFDSGKYIVHLTDSYSPMKLLYNSFCLGPDEVLNLEGIYLIEANALEGCQTTKVINANATQSMFIADTERPNNSEENKVYAYDLIAEALAYKKNDVLDWLKDEYSDRQLMITVPFDEYVGRGFVLDKKKGLIKEYETKDITLCLEKDLYSKTGFGLVTAYPELRNEERIQKTERDLSYVAKQTKTYKNATALGKAYILYRTNPQSKTIVKYKEDRHTGEEYILLQSKIRPKEGKPLKINTIKMNEDFITLRTSQYRDESGRGRPEPIETRLSEMAEERGFGNKFSVNLKDPEIQEKFSTTFKNACNAMRQVQDAIKAVQRDALGRDERVINSVEEER